jgi:hypothetical protein
MNRSASSVLLSVFLAAGLAGCGLGGVTAGPTPAASASADRQQLLALGQEWVRCVRDKGLPRMPDAEVNQEGYLQFPASDDYNWKEEMRDRQDIIEACKPIEDRYPPNAFRPKQQFSSEDLRKLAEYAECLRTHGLPEWPDPDAAGTFDLSGTSLATGIAGPVHDQAEQACRSIWSGEVRVDGVSGGKK